MARNWMWLAPLVALACVASPTFAGAEPLDRIIIEPAGNITAEGEVAIRGPSTTVVCTGLRFSGRLLASNDQTGIETSIGYLDSGPPQHSCTGGADVTFLMSAEQHWDIRLNLPLPRRDSGVLANITMTELTIEADFLTANCLYTKSSFTGLLAAPEGGTNLFGGTGQLTLIRGTVCGCDQNVTVEMGVEISPEQELRLDRAAFMRLLASSLGDVLLV